eukprot:3394923-Pleurochrysis_carterae.AAC.1
MRAWEAFGELFSTWRDEWSKDSKEYRAKRALRFLHAACRLAKALNKISNYKHKSEWYVHMVVFIVSQQIAAHGDMWRSSTAAIESRDARLKRIGRST